MPELLDDLAAAFGEDLGETAALFVAEGVILADGRNLLVTLLQAPIAERMGEGAPGVSGDADDVLDALALGEIVGGDDRDEIRCAGALDVVGDRKAGIGQEVADQHVAIALLDQAPRLLQRGVGIGRIVLDHEFNLAAGDLVVHRLQIKLHALDHLLAAGGDHASERRQKADLDGSSLRACAPPRRSGRASGRNSDGGIFKKLPAVHFNVLSKRSIALIASLAAVLAR